MVKVMIETECQPGKEVQLKYLLKELRSEAVKQNGYICGETLREVDNPSIFCIISTWIKLESWREWQTSQQRLSIEDTISSLTTLRKISIFIVDYNS